jgi:hypothetical protein
MAETSDTLVTQRCRFLTSKEMFYDIGQDASAPQPGSGLFWCSQTQNCLGPDGSGVHAKDCGPNRSCYQEL